MRSFRSRHIILNSFLGVFLKIALAGVVCFVVCLPLVFSQPVVSDAPAPNMPAASDISNSVEKTDKDQELLPEDLEDKEFNDFNDPFEPASPSEKLQETALEPVPETIIPKEISPPTLMIRGAVWGIKPCKAIINDRIYGEGDTIEGTDAKILRIDESGILYEYQEKRFLLKRSQWNDAGKEGA